MSKKRVKIAPIDKLTPKRLPPSLEDELRELYLLACQNSKPLWKELKSHQETLSQELKNKFVSLVHSGMRQAQESMLRSLLDNQVDELYEYREFAYRGIANSIAWQLLKNELALRKEIFPSSSTSATGQF